MMFPGPAEAVAAETPAEAPAGWVTKQSGVTQEHGFAFPFVAMNAVKSAV